MGTEGGYRDREIGWVQRAGLEGGYRDRETGGVICIIRHGAISKIYRVTAKRLFLLVDIFFYIGPPI